MDMNSSINLTQVVKLLISFASFCFLYPNALHEIGRAEVPDSASEPAATKVPAV